MKSRNLKFSLQFAENIKCQLLAKISALDAVYKQSGIYNQLHSHLSRNQQTYLY